MFVIVLKNGDRMGQDTINTIKCFENCFGEELAWDRDVFAGEPGRQATGWAVTPCRSSLGGRCRLAAAHWLGGDANGAPGTWAPHPEEKEEAELEGGAAAKGTAAGTRR